MKVNRNWGLSVLVCMVLAAGSIDARANGEIFPALFSTKCQRPATVRLERYETRQVVRLP